MSGSCDPYPGKLGATEEGAFSDMILVDGNQLEILIWCLTPIIALTDRIGRVTNMRHFILIFLRNYSY